MKHEKLREKCRKAFGDKIPMAAREKWALFITEERTEFTFRYEWIKDWRLFDWVRSNIGCLDIRDGTEQVGIYVCKSNGEPLNEY